MSTIIKVENLSKKYIISHQQLSGKKTFREAITQSIGNFKSKFMHPFSTNFSKDSPLEEFWALKDINFEVKQGERIGIIGRNGAGKSTLLKILSRITEPSTGKIVLKGRVASLLEVGTGFNGELSGRENIYLNGAILGMHRAEIKKKFDEIVDFSGVEKFLDTPVKRYSSGMYVRLAFAVAAHLDPEILIVDEVLAVGDAEFQNKCLGKMQDVSQNYGRTVLFVSHNMAAIQKLCETGIILLNGQIIQTGAIQKIVDRYINSNDDSTSKFTVPKNREIDRAKGYAHTLQVEDQENNLLTDVPVGTPWQIRVGFTLNEKIDYFIIALGFRTMLDLNILTSYSPRMNLGPGEYEVLFKETQLIFGEGRLKISLGLSSYEKSIHYIEDFAHICFTAINNNIKDPRIIRTAASAILNPLEVEINKK